MHIKDKSVYHDIFIAYYMMKLNVINLNIKYLLKILSCL